VSLRSKLLTLEAAVVEAVSASREIRVKVGMPLNPKKEVGQIILILRPSVYPDLTQGQATMA
jgi:hypothetical protein